VVIVALPFAVPAHDEEDPVAEPHNPFAQSQQSQNPFAAQGAEPPPGQAPPGGGGTGGGPPSSIRPFRGAAVEAEQLPKRLLKQKVKDLGIGDPNVLARNQLVANLTVYDLQDLAARFQGVESSNPKIAQLSIQDLQDLEGIFYDYKMNTSKELTAMASAQGEVSAEWSVSCCSCTPCCCCAAAEVNPVAA
jgi:hypothetical protein